MLTYQSTFALKYDGQCGLLGVSPDHRIYVEEIYGDEEWLAQHTLSFDGEISTLQDEHYGSSEITPLKLPASSVQPQSARQTKQLNYTGARLRGMRENERIDVAVRPMTIQTKMALVERLNLNILPPHILGMAESSVLSEAKLNAAPLYVVCRRIQIAYLLPQIQYDESGQPYDYDTYAMHIAHLYDPATQDDLSVDEAFEGLPGVHLHWPTDCLVFNDQLLIAESGQQQNKSAIHIWRIQA